MPYLKEVMDSFVQADIETITLCTATQVGKTETLNNCLGYVIAQDPSSSLVVYPTEDLAKSVSKNRLDPMINSSPALRERYDPRRSETLELQFVGAYVALVGANSPSSLSSRPIRYLFLDEVDKYPPFSGDEADPVSLARERTKTYRNKKIFQVSTPTTEYGRIYREYESADVRMAYHVPCPHCGKMQKLIMAQIKWPERVKQLKRAANGDPLKLRDASQLALETAWYECPYCNGIIDDVDKLDALRKGEWVGDRVPETPPRHIAYHLSSIYSPFVSFGQVAEQFIESEEFPEKLRNFINGWLGEPWRDSRKDIKFNVLMDQKADYRLGDVVRDVHFLTAAVDVQLDHFWWQVMGWGIGASSWVIDFGRAETWEEIEEIIVNRQYPTLTGETQIVRLAAVDSGYRTDEVYEFATLHGDVIRPVKGASASLGGRFYSISNLDKDGFAGLKLFIVDGNYWKDYIHGRLQKPPGSIGAMVVPENCPEYWFTQMTSEHKVIERNRRTGRETEEWVKISQHAPNHLWDCTVYNSLVAEICGVRYLTNETQAETHPEPSSTPGGSWIGNKSGWLRR